MKYSKKDSKALTILLLQWLGEEKNRYVSKWQDIYDYHNYAFPICDYVHCDKCPISRCSTYICLLIDHELPLRERKKRAALMVRKVRSLKW